MIKEKIENLINDVLEDLKLPFFKNTPSIKLFSIEHPKRLDFGDYGTNLLIRMGPVGHTQQIIDTLNKRLHLYPEIERIDEKMLFINFHLSKKFLAESLGEIIKQGGNFGKGEHAKGLRVMVEHTDPNPFKE